MKLLNIRFLFALVATALFGTGCLKDDNFDDGRYGINLDGVSKIVEIAGPVDGFVNVDLIGSPSDTTVDLALVRLAGGNADKDVQVTLALDPTVVTAFNTEHGTNYTAPAANLFSIPSLTVTIPAGQKTGNLRLKAKPNDLFGGAYALGVRVVSVSDPSVKISSNWNTQVVGLTIRNKYDGVYSVESGFVQRYTAPGVPESPSALSGPLAGNPDVSLVTFGTNTVEIQGLNWTASQGGVGGINNLRATVDPATNLVTLSALGNATLANWAGHENKYDPATKTFYLAFRWNPATTTREYEVVLKYKHPR